MSELRTQIGEALEYIRSKTSTTPKIGIILGTGLGGLVKEIKKEVVLEYGNIPHFPVSTVESHHGKLIFGTLALLDIRITTAPSLFSIGLLL